MNKNLPQGNSASDHLQTRFFFDSSSIFALIDCGYLHRFCDLVPNCCITTDVHAELTKKDILPKKIILEYVALKKISVIRPKTENSVKWENYRALGLHIGEISIFLTARKNLDVVVFDDLVARAVARSEGFLLTGLLGILLKLQKTSKISKNEALSILSALNRTNFRMSAALFETIFRELSES